MSTAIKMPWFRAYTRMVDDDKLKLLAFEDRWHFVALLCLKGEGLLDKGDAPALMMRKVAVKMGLDVRTLEEVARRLAEVDLIDQQTLQPIKWAGLQMRSDADPTAAERKRRQRKRRKDGEDTDASRVTGTNVTRTDTDTDTEIGTSVIDLEVGGGSSRPEAPPAAAPTPSTGQPDASAPESAPPQPSPAKPPKTPTATRLPADWRLPRAWGEWALSERPDMTADDVRREAETFADYWRAKAGADARKLDWQATWRNWVRRSDGGKPAQRQRSQAAPPASKYAGAAKAIFDGIEI